MTVTSDATDAYQRVNPDVRRVERTLVFVKPDVLVFLDRVVLATTTATIQARFQVFNEDERGTCAVAGPTFRIDRPFATLHAQAAATGDFTVGTGRIAIAESEGVFPFVEVAAAPAREHVILTLCAATPAGEAPGAMTLSRQGGTWQVQGTHRGQKVQVMLATEGRGPPKISL